MADEAEMHSKVTKMQELNKIFHFDIDSGKLSCYNVNNNFHFEGGVDQ
jgi:hypothetical protein